MFLFSPYAPLTPLYPSLLPSHALPRSPCLSLALLPPPVPLPLPSSHRRSCLQTGASDSLPGLSLFTRLPSPTYYLPAISISLSCLYTHVQKGGRSSLSRQRATRPLSTLPIARQLRSGVFSLRCRGWQSPCIPISHSASPLLPTRSLCVLPWPTTSHEKTKLPLPATCSAASFNRVHHSAHLPIGTSHGRRHSGNQGP